MRSLRMQNRTGTNRRIRYAGAVSTLALVTAVGGGTAWAAHGSQGGHHGHHAKHKNHYVITSTSQISPSVLDVLHALQGQIGMTGATGATGSAGSPGTTGSTGPQGPGAVEYTYDSTAPAATDQNTPLGPAGPFGELTGSCIVQAGIVEVLLGTTNNLNVSFDETRVDAANGAPATVAFQSITQTASATPQTVIGEPNDTNIGDSYNHTSLLVTSPSHGDLEIYQHVSHANNTCHMSVVWTPAS